MIYGDEDFEYTLKQMIKESKVALDGVVEKHNAYRHSCYKECVDHAEEMSWHLYGTKPETLLSRARPREDPEVKAYRLDNYEPTTKSAADKVINIFSKIFNPNLYSIRWEKEGPSSAELKEYTLEYYPEHTSVVNFTKDVLLRKMLADPNAVAAVKPIKLPGYKYVYDENAEDKQRLVQDQTEQIEPIVVIYGSSCIWNFDYDHYLIFIRTEEERTPSQNTITWYYFEYYDNEEIIQFRAYVSASSNNLVYEETEPRYPHGCDKIPVWKLQGVPESKDNGEIIYKSYINAAAPYWNYAIIHESDVLGAYIGHLHPLRIEVSEPCNHVHDNKYKCIKGRIVTESGEKFACPSCDGTGNKSAGPYSVIKIPRDKLADAEGNSIRPADAVSYVTVPTEATRMLEERADRMRKMGMWAINMDVEDEVGEVQSGAAKVIDRSAQYDTLYNIGCVIFDVHLQNIFYFFNKYMFQVADRSAGKDPEGNLPEINKPTQFDIASTAELVANYKVAKESGLDPNFLQLKQIEIGTRDLTTNPDLKQFTNLLLDLDPLPGMSAQDISLNVSRLLVRQVDAVIKNNIKRFIERAIEENPKFMELKKSEQKATLEKYGEEFINQNKPKIDPSILDQYAKEKKKKETPLV